MPNDVPLSQLINIRSRFLRSVSLPRDCDLPDALDGYILTPSGRDILGRLAAAIRGESPARAWSLTGPYGTGKSAFALFAAQVLGGKGVAAAKARSILESRAPLLWKKFFQRGSCLSAGGSLWPVVVTGSREALEPALASALLGRLRQCCKNRLPRALVTTLEEIARGNKRGSSTLVELFSEAFRFVASSGAKVRGFLLIIDELGKFLEYAASHPDEGDVFVLQGLAEAAARSEKPFLLVTILHQSVERYTAHISPSRRQEWSKVQGRFEDIAFEEPTEQMVRLLAEAIQHRGPKRACEALEKLGAKLAAEAWLLGGRPGSLGKPELISLLSACMPLHPSVSLLLGPLFRRLAQNERSVFAFLSSGEPFGLQEFLSGGSADGSGTVYTLDLLYDYVTTALGSALYSQQRGKQWAEVESTLERLHSASPLEIRVAKAIGLLQSVGYGGGLPASRDHLRFALRASAIHDRAIDAAISALEERSVIVYRRHADSYALWEGSDVNIDGRMEDARRTIDPGRQLTGYLAELAPPRPMVARRHSYGTGTLRYFEVLFAGYSDLPTVFNRPLGGADGRIVYCLPMNAEEQRLMEGALTASPLKETPLVIAVLPGQIHDLKEVCQELACLRWVLENTPELAGDATARRELRARLSATESALDMQLRQSYSPDKRSRCRWFHKGQKVGLASPRHLNEFLSHLCDEVYWATPRWPNELINRRNLSSSAAAARRNLIEAMIERHDHDRLGIEGDPPERSMYESLLASSGIHRREHGTWSFCPPRRRVDRALTAIWKAVEDFLQQADERPRPIAGLFATLGSAPFGLKDGVLPVLLAATLLYYDTEVALYEQGTFVPVLTTAVFERILRSPDLFEAQHCRISGPRAIVFSKYATMILGSEVKRKEDKPQLLRVVRPLFKFVRQLPEYVVNTQQLSPTAKAVLTVLREARHPDQMLFTDLPSACGWRPFGARGSLDAQAVEAYFGTLRAALGELQQAYPRLQADVGNLLMRAFGLAGPLAQWRQELTHRARLVFDLAVDPKLKSFVVRVTDTASDDAIWLESIAALLAGQPSRGWTDQERARFEVNLALMARTLQHFEALAFEMERQGAPLLDGDDQALRVAVTLPKEQEVERVVRIPSRLAGKVEKVQAEVRQTLATSDFLGDREVAVQFHLPPAIDAGPGVGSLRCR
jgi:hypothetical protein